MNCGFCHLASGHRSVKESNQDGNNRVGEKVEIKREMYTLRRIVRDEIQMPEFHHEQQRTQIRVIHAIRAKKTSLAEKTIEDGCNPI